MLAEASTPADTAPSQGFSLREFIHDEAFGGILLLRLRPHRADLGQLALG